MTDFAFEQISEAELKAEVTAPARARTKKSKFDTEDRSVTGWFRLPHVRGFCTVPMHDEIQALLSDEDKEFRQKYPVRMTYKIEPYEVCRDCYVEKADNECREQDLPPLVFDYDDS